MMKKLEVVSGCYETTVFVDGIDINISTTEEIQELITKLLPKLSKIQSIDILELMINNLGEYEGDESPCEQCGSWGSVVTLNLE